MEYVHCISKPNPHCKSCSFFITPRPGGSWSVKLFIHSWSQEDPATVTPSLLIVGAFNGRCWLYMPGWLGSPILHFRLSSPWVTCSCFSNFTIDAAYHLTLWITQPQKYRLITIVITGSSHGMVGKHAVVVIAGPSYDSAPGVATGDPLTLHPGQTVMSGQWVTIVGHHYRTVNHQRWPCMSFNIIMYVYMYRPSHPSPIAVVCLGGFCLNCCSIAGMMLSNLIDQHIFGLLNQPPDRRPVLVVAPYLLKQP